MSTFFTESVKMLTITGVTYEIESEPLYFVSVVDAIPSWSSIEKSLIKITENYLYINNYEICDEFTYVKNYANAK